MKRSQINKAVKDMEEMAGKQGFHLPPFCGFSPEEWEKKGREYDEIRDNALGWDITDFGHGDFDHVGMSLVTIRNGNIYNKKYTKPYAEKLIFMYDGQTAPFHFHRYKMEDIINRGGGELDIQVYLSKEDGALDTESEVEVWSDGRRYTVPAGTKVRLSPGQSISIYQGLYHQFITVPGTGDVLIGEVSMCNDDDRDNFFLEPAGRFPEIIEDEKPYRLLCKEYPAAEEGK